jgi:hypothetical protein
MTRLKNKTEDSGCWNPLSGIGALTEAVWGCIVFGGIIGIIIIGGLIWYFH